MKTKDKIIKNALKLFLQKGFYNVSISMIAQNTGISKPAIYHHFRSKDELVKGVLDLFTSKMTTWSQDYFSRVESGRDFLEKIFSAIPLYKNVELILLDEEQGNYPYSYNDLLMTLSKYKSSFRKRIAEDIRQTTTKIKTNIDEMISAEQVRGEINSVDLALMVHCIIEGSAFLSEINENLYLERSVGNLFNTFWEMIKKRSNNE